ncbi:RES family NAD+ phosphorylase [bacterium]|nr:RES family NAD+ phosphorylase [bacterium]
MRFVRKYELDRYNDIGDIAEYKRKTSHIQRFHWDYYNELAYQRSEIFDKLQLALIEKSVKSYDFDGWQRAVKYKYSLNPLSMEGSVTDPGGRFNIGAIDTTKFPMFPALYVAKEKETAIEELLAQKSDTKTQGMDPLEVALTKKDSITIVAVRGLLDQIFDLHDSENLRPFFKLIKTLKLSRKLIASAKKLKQTCRLVKSIGELSYSLLAPTWRQFPQLVDIPANSQIFGQIVLAAGIQGILYPSKFSNKQCLAIFPQTFLNSGSFVELIGDLPQINIPRRMDSGNWETFVNPKPLGS